jgi:transposase
MRGPYPRELRVRVIEFVEAGGSRRDAAEHFQVSSSSAIRWLQRFREDGTSEPIPPWRERLPVGEVFAADSRPYRRATGPYVE